MRLHKKAQGLPLNVIIIAAIALLVLVVLAVIFLGRSGGFAESTKSCATQGGQCLEDCGNNAVLPGATCPTGQTCCLVLEGRNDAEPTTPTP